MFAYFRRIFRVSTGGGGGGGGAPDYALTYNGDYVLFNGDYIIVSPGTY